MEVKEKRIIDSVKLTQEEQKFLLDLAIVVKTVCDSHIETCEYCPLSDNNRWDCDSFRELAENIGKRGGF